MSTARFVVCFFSRDDRELIIAGGHYEDQIKAILTEFKSNFDVNDWDEAPKELAVLEAKLETGDLEMEEVIEFFDSLDIDFEWKFAEDLGI